MCQCREKRTRVLALGATGMNGQPNFLIFQDRESWRIQPDEPPKTVA